MSHDGQPRDSVSHLPHPHFSTRGGLLYRVAEGEGGVREQLVVPRAYVSKVLYMAHTHLLGLPMTRAAREKTAFSTPGGLYQYTVLPFGVHGAPATFQHMMDRLL